MRLRFLSGGESHGKMMVGIVEGFPKGFTINREELINEVNRRKDVFCRSKRFLIENDNFEIVSGLVGGITTGGPISFLFENKDFENYKDAMDVWNGDVALKSINAIRPGHADYAGSKKYDFSDSRLIAERASARDTVCINFVGAISRQILKSLGIDIKSEIEGIGGKIDNSAITKALENGDSVGGSIKVIASGYPVGVGSFVEIDRKLDGRIAGVLMSINAVKAVSFGIGCKYKDKYGSEVIDPIGHNGPMTNNAGGIEGGMSTGKDIVVNLVFKPIPTISKGINTINYNGDDIVFSAERSDVTGVLAGAVIAENALAYSLLDNLLDTFGSDTFIELKSRVNERKNK